MNESERVTVWFGAQVATLGVMAGIGGALTLLVSALASIATESPEPLVDWRPLVVWLVGSGVGLVVLAGPLLLLPPERAARRERRS